MQHSVIFSKLPTDHVTVVSEKSEVAEKAQRSALSDSHQQRLLCCGSSLVGLAKNLKGAAGACQTASTLRACCVTTQIVSIDLLQWPRRWTVAMQQFFLLAATLAALLRAISAASDPAAAPAFFGREDDAAWPERERIGNEAVHENLQ